MLAKIVSNKTIPVKYTIAWKENYFLTDFFSLTGGALTAVGHSRQRTR